MNLYRILALKFGKQEDARGTDPKRTSPNAKGVSKLTLELGSVHSVGRSSKLLSCGLSVCLFVLCVLFGFLYDYRLI